ncbi:2-oxo-4-hydroxy-4-carboxy-5-ureidoimidazoline decarboxylase [soil metagenome]
MKITDLNNCGSETAKIEILKCCTSEEWAKRMVKSLPFEDLDAMTEIAEDIWTNRIFDKDRLEAFSGHPKIGDVNSLKEKYANTAAMAGNEQAGVDTASNKTIEELARFNSEYESKFGYIFIVCATGKSAEEMLDILKSRINNDPKKEMIIASEEQNKITKIRINKIFEEE